MCYWYAREINFWLIIKALKLLWLTYITMKCVNQLPMIESKMCLSWIRKMNSLLQLLQWEFSLFSYKR
jgi:hypothetical protein